LFHCHMVLCYSATGYVSGWTTN